MEGKVNFEVVKIEKANKPNFVVANIKFEESEKIYSYVRKSYKGSTIIDGCEIKFDEETFEVKSVERIYDTAGRKRRDTSSISKRRKLSEDIKKEAEENKVEIPKVKEKVSYDANKEVFHEKFEIIKACVENNIPVYLAGPAGSGKNHTLEQIAKQLGLKFYFTNSVQQEYKLTGFIDAGGEYHETEFFKAFNNGGLFFLDEMDASIPEVLVLLNAAIANGYFEFPIGRVKCHKDFRVVAAGNTVGNGADEQYTGRMVLDQATLDRFAVIEFGYSLPIEMHLAKGDADLVNFVHQLREEAESKGIRATFSYRCITMVAKLENVMDMKDIMVIAIMKGFDKDTIRTFHPVGDTKYHKALKEIQAA